VDTHSHRLLICNEQSKSKHEADSFHHPRTARNKTKRAAMFQQQQGRPTAVVPDPQHYHKQLEMMNMASAPDESFDNDAHFQPQAPPPASAPPPPPIQAYAVPQQQLPPQPQPQLVYGNNKLVQPPQPVATVATTMIPQHHADNDSPGKPGFNKLCRDQAKLMLVLTTAFLFVNANGPAMASSALAIFILKRGTLWSHKNWKWGMLSCLSFLVSSTGYFWVRGSNEINPNRAYGTEKERTDLMGWMDGWMDLCLTR
jgi:hypothetical protein